jgi:hypothetical protein
MPLTTSSILLMSAAVSRLPRCFRNSFAASGIRSSTTPCRSPPTCVSALATSSVRVLNRTFPPLFSQEINLLAGNVIDHEELLS